MKKIILLSSLTIFIFNTSFADELHHYDQIKNAALTGKTIHITVDFTQCASSNAVTQIDNFGVFTPNAMLVANDHIATSLNHFTINSPSFPNKPVYEFVTYRITTNDEINITAQTLDAVNYAPLNNKTTYNCKLDASAKIFD